MSDFELTVLNMIHSLLPPKKIIGDDAAFLPWRQKNLLVSTDSLVEGVHYKSEWMDFYAAGLHACAMNISDMAAMGAKPKFFLIALHLPKLVSLKNIKDFYLGFLKHSQAHKAQIVGGNISRTDGPFLVTVTVFGENKWPVWRHTARVKDLVFVTGKLGQARLGRECLAQKKLVKKWGQAFICPPSRVAFASKLAKEQMVTAMMDISDGLLADCKKMARAAGKHIVLDADKCAGFRTSNFESACNTLKISVREAIFCGGEDYELLFTVSPKHLNKLVKLGSLQRVPLTCIGHITDLKNNSWVSGIDLTGLTEYSHFA